MKKLLLAMAVCLCGAVSAENVVLDLSNPQEALSYDDNGLWSDAFNDNAKVTSQVFTFAHRSPYPQYSCGFFASKVTTILASAGSDDQYGCMAKGGVAGEGTPYLGAYWDTYNESEDWKSCEVKITSPHYAVGCYVCNNPYVYYVLQKGNDFGGKFEQGDWFKLVAHGLDENRTETGTVEYYLADYRSANADEWTLNDSWQWFDLSSLGQVASVYFTMESSDTGEWGMNTPGYFCLDKLTVSTEPASVDKTLTAEVRAYYDRTSGVVRVESASPVEAAVYSLNGTAVLKQLVDGSAALDLRACPSGVYVVRCGGYSVKVIK